MRKRGFESNKITRQLIFYGTITWKSQESIIANFLFNIIFIMYNLSCIDYFELGFIQIYGLWVCFFFLDSTPSTFGRNSICAKEKEVVPNFKIELLCMHYMLQ